MEDDYHHHHHHGSHGAVKSSRSSHSSTSTVSTCSIVSSTKQLISWAPASDIVFVTNFGNENEISRLCVILIYQGNPISLLHCNSL
jgi:hypothetical protein